MPTRKLILLAVALLIAGGTVMLSRAMLTPPPAPPPVEKVEAPVAPPPPLPEILVASHDLPAGTLLRDLDVKWDPRPADSDLTGYIVHGKNDRDYLGAVVRRGLTAGEAIMLGRITAKHERGFMAAILNPGFRAVSINITDIGGVMGFVFPGDRVDVLLSQHYIRRVGTDFNDDRRISQTLLRDVRVLAVDQRADDQSIDLKVSKSVTLEVSEKQAEQLALAPDIGVLSLSLRSAESLGGAASTDKPKEGETPVTAVSQTPTPPSDAPGEFTWDSDVSKVMHKPSSRAGDIEHVQILRGKERTDTVFEPVK